MRADGPVGLLAVLSIIPLASCEYSSSELATEVNRQEVSSVDAAAQLTWPDNEPAGMTTLTHVRGDSKNWPGWNPFGTGHWHDTTRVVVVDDPDAKYGEAVEKRFFVGDVSGWGSPTKGAFQGPGQTFPRQLWKEVYVRYVFRYSPNWDFHGGGDKLWLANDAQQAIGTSFYTRCGTYYVGAQFVGPPITTRQWYPILPDAPQQTTITGPCAGVGVIYPRAERNVYHTIEVWKRMNDPGVANGGMRVWIDGVEYTRFNGLGGPAPEYADAALVDREWATSVGVLTSGISTRIEAPLHWGGQNDVKTVNDWIRISEIYVSVRDSTSPPPPPPPPTGIGEPVSVSTQQGNNHNGSVTFTVGSDGVPEDATLFVDYAAYANDSGTSVSVADDSGNIFVADWEESDHAGGGGFSSLQSGRWRTRVATALSQGSTITISGLGTGPSNRRFRAQAYYIEGLAEDPLIDVSVSGTDQGPSGDITASPEAIFLGSMYTRCTDSTSEDLDFAAISEGGPGVSIRPVRLRTSYRIIASAEETRGYEASPGGSCTAYRSGISAYQAEQP